MLGIIKLMNEILHDTIIFLLCPRHIFLHKKIFKDPVVFENGFIEIPTGPGLGVEFDPKVLEKHIVS